MWAAKEFEVTNCVANFDRLNASSQLTLINRSLKTCRNQSPRTDCQRWKRI
jgi:hypothetical protein